MVLTLNSEKIVWPGNLHKKPSGLMIPTHLQVLTINEKPFVYSRQIGPCKEEPCPPPCNKENGEIPCPIYNTTHQEQNGEAYLKNFLFRYFILYKNQSIFFCTINNK